MCVCRGDGCVMNLVHIMLLVVGGSGCMSFYFVYIDFGV